MRRAIRPIFTDMQTPCVHLPDVIIIMLGGASTDLQYRGQVFLADTSLSGSLPEFNHARLRAMQFFLTGWLLGLSIAIPFGPVSMMCVEQSLSRGVLRGLVSGTGAATSHGFYATLAVLGTNAAAGQLISLQGAIHVLSGLIFALLGLKTILRKPVRQMADDATRGGLADYAGGLALALANPMTLLPYLAFAGSLVVSGARDSRLSVPIVVGIALGTLSWYWTISGSAWLLRQHLPRGILARLNLISGSILIAMGVLTALR
jgi:threonine/homoserine/homoserine lactone efflux protein